MDVFKLFESTVAEIQPGYKNAGDLRRDQLLDNYDAAVKALQCLIRAKENELAYRRDLIGMLEQAKTYYDKKSLQARQAYENAKRHVPEESNEPRAEQDRKPESISTTPVSTGNTPAPTTPASSLGLSQSGDQPLTPPATNFQMPMMKNSDLDIPMPSDNHESRSSLDRRLSEFLKTFPNLSQAGLAPPTTGTTDNNNLSNNSANVRPLPGYYTQQPPPPPPTSISAAPPLMAMMRFPPPPILPPNQQHAPVPPPLAANLNLASQENHDTADMDLSDHDEPTNSVGIIPMIASAMQQGAGGKHGIRSEQSFGGAGQQYNNQVPQQYPSRLNALPFDPSIMDPNFSSPMSSGSSSRDKHSHSDRGSHRHSSSGSSGSGTKHGLDKSSKYSSSSHSSKNKRR